MRGRLARWLAAAALAAAALPAWADAPLRPAERARILETLAGAPAEGLPPVRISPDASDEALERAVLAHAAALRGQRLNGRFPHDWALRPVRFDPEPAFRDARAARQLGPWLDALAPRHGAYVELRRALARYRAIAQRGGWERLAFRPLRPGDHGAEVAALRARLAVERGPGPEPLDPRAFDYMLFQRLSEEQARLGVPVTGRLDRATIEALNIPVEDRIAQIVLNLERERWLPARLPDFRLEVNIAEQRLEAIGGGRALLSMKTVVGRPETPTPMMRDVIVGAVFNPPWNVPTRLAQATILPRARRDRTYLARNGYVLLEDGRVQQLPGPESGLGKIKFEMRNPLAVYLHDTPARRLFDEPVRAFSNGCIRLEAAEALMWLVFEHGGGWDEASLRSALRAGDTVLAETRAATPVFVVYRTAFARDGLVHFRPDLYGWDAELAGLLD